MKELVEKYKARPRMIQRVDTYGPLVGGFPGPRDILGHGRIDNSPHRTRCLRRTIYQPILASLHHGRVVTTTDGDVRPASNLDMIPNALARRMRTRRSGRPGGNRDNIARPTGISLDAVYFLCEQSRGRRKSGSTTSARSLASDRNPASTRRHDGSFALGKLKGCQQRPPGTG